VQEVEELPAPRVARRVGDRGTLLAQALVLAPLRGGGAQYCDTGDPVAPEGPGGLDDPRIITFHQNDMPIHRPGPAGEILEEAHGTSAGIVTAFHPAASAVVFRIFPRRLP
jgi:hypothetical protein